MRRCSHSCHTAQWLSRFSHIFPFWIPSTFNGKPVNLLPWFKVSGSRTGAYFSPFDRGLLKCSNRDFCATISMGYVFNWKAGWTRARPSFHTHHSRKKKAWTSDVTDFHTGNVASSSSSQSRLIDYSQRSRRTKITNWQWRQLQHGNTTSLKMEGEKRAADEATATEDDTALTALEKTSKKKKDLAQVDGFLFPCRQPSSP